MKEQDVKNLLEQAKELVVPGTLMDIAFDEAVRLISLPKHIWHSTASGSRPEKKGFVKVTIVHNTTNKKYTSDVLYDPATDRWIGLNDRYKVIAWMEEPEPYDGE